MRQSTLWFAAIVLGSAMFATMVQAQTFRMETDVFSPPNKEAVLQYLTLFTQDMVYDFRVTSPEEITIVDVNRNRIVLIDSTRKVKTTLTTADLLQSIALIRVQVKQNNPVFFAAANPVFETNFDEATDWLTLSGEQLTYRIKGSKPKQQIESVRRYQEFADWSARISAIRPGNLPPHARIAVNKIVADREWLPEEVERVIPPTRLGGKKLEMKTRHHVNWVLSETDKKRIDRAGDALALFKEVSFQDYRAEPTANNQPKKGTPPTGS